MPSTELSGPLETEHSLTRRVKWFFAAAISGAIISFLLPPFKQPQAYHHFADTRTMLGIPNCLNVLSNLPFLLVGIIGVWKVARSTRFLDPREKAAYAVFFLGSCATCLGSGYYHWSPQDSTLAWDRLPMTLAFMSLLAAMVAERISVKVGSALLWPLVVAGAASVGWWRWTGNLWPYAMAQYYTIVLVAWLMIAFPPRYSRSADLLAVTGFYALAKVFEALDGQIFGLTQNIVSGHSLKHLIAAMAVAWLLRMLEKRNAASPRGGQ